MLQRNHTLLFFILLMTCTVSSFMHGMKRNVNMECVLPANGESLPQDILEQIFTCLCENLINTPLNTPLFVQKSKPTIFNFNRYFSGNSQWHIAPNGNIAYLAGIRSVCKQWYDLLNPAEIKRRLHINADDIAHDLAIINAWKNQKNRSHAQFLAQMIKGQVDACNNILPKAIYNDSDKLKILLENGLVDPNCYFSGNLDLKFERKALYPSPLGCCIAISSKSHSCIKDFNEESFCLLLNHGADVHQKIDNGMNIIDVLLSFKHRISSKEIIDIIAEKEPLIGYQDKINKMNINLRSYNIKFCSMMTAIIVLIIILPMSYGIYNQIQYMNRNTSVG